MKKNDEIMVSICCITYNHEKYIAEAIESFLMQKTDFKYEILIHDDASTDNTANIVKEYEKRYPDIIKPIYQVQNQYSQKKLVSSNNYNRAKGKYIAICEGDDYWTDLYKLQKQFNYMEENPLCGLCFHTVKKVDDLSGKIIGKISPYNEDRIVNAEEVILGGGDFIGTNSIFCRSELLKKLPKFFMNSPVGDYPLQILTSCNDYAYFMKESMSVYRVNIKGSWTLRNINRDIDETKKNEEEIYTKLVDMLLEFNCYSNKKYENVILEEIKEYEFKKLLLNDNLKKVKSEEYREFYKKLYLREKVKVYLGYYFPREAKILLKIYRKIKFILIRMLAHD